MQHFLEKCCIFHYYIFKFESEAIIVYFQLFCTMIVFHTLSCKRLKVSFSSAIDNNPPYFSMHRLATAFPYLANFFNSSIEQSSGLSLLFTN